MKDLIEGAQFLGIPTIIAIILVGIYFLIDLKTKVMPEIVSLKKRYEKKKQKEIDALNEQKEQKKMLAEMQKSLTEMKSSVDASVNEMKSHYTPEKLEQRDSWMTWVNNRAVVYDDALSKLLLLQDKLNENNEITLDLYINVNRNRILDFARIVADDNALASREEFNRIYKVNREYHAILAKYNKENGEVDTAMKLIEEAYDYRMKHHSFIEDIRGYDK